MLALTVRDAKILQKKHTTYHYSGPHPGDLGRESPVPSRLSKPGLGQSGVPTPSVLNSLPWLKPSSGYNYSQANRIRGALKSKKSN